MMSITAWPRMMEPEMAKAYAGGEKIFEDLIAKEFLKARVQGKGLTRYDRLEIDAALDRWKGFET